MVTTNLTSRIRRNSTHLVSLIDGRARADGQVQRLTAMLSDIQLELNRALEQRDAAEVLLGCYYVGVDVSKVSPVCSYLGRDGKRGDIVRHIRAFLGAAGPGGATTTQIANYLIGVFQFEFPTAAVRGAWHRNSVGGRLRELKQSGEVEPMHDTTRAGCAVGRWRVKQAPSGGLSSLHELARSTGVRVEVLTDGGDSAA